MKTLLAVGACYLDTILNVDHYPTEDSKLRASSILRRRGGNCPNTLEVLQQLLDATPHILPISSLALCAVLPSSSSPAYQEIKSSFAGSTSLRHCICREDCTEPASSYIIRSKAVDSRTIINYNGLREMTVEEFVGVVDRLGKGIGWCHFEGNGYHNPEECFRGQAAMASNASLSLCTWGESGVTAGELPSQKVTACPAFKVEGHKAVDTVGAGDTFIAGMLFGLTCYADDWTLNRKLLFANELAGRKVVQEGFRGLGSLIQHSL
ncbi:MAG: hypothetical protein Q9186_006017 [Xanthomendoza sp. 1 TL-2023]